MSRGIRTTEFWLVVFANLITLAESIAGQIDPQTATIIIASLTGIYNVLRTLIKKPEITTLIETKPKG